MDSDKIAAKHMYKQRTVRLPRRSSSSNLLRLFLQLLLIAIHYVLLRIRFWVAGLMGSNHVPLKNKPVC